MTLNPIRRAVALLPALLSALLALCAALGLAGGLSGCASMSAPRSNAAVAPYRADLALSGRIAVHYTRDGKAESLSGSFTWQQTAERTDVSLISPTGQTVAVISVTPHSATLKQSDKAARSAPDLNSLMQQTLGWSLPVSGLREWLQGHAVAADGSQFSASPAHDAVVTRDGWKLEYLSWQNSAAATPQPKRIDVTRLGAGQLDDLSFRIVIDSPAD